MPVYVFSVDRLLHTTYKRMPQDIHEEYLICDLVNTITVYHMNHELFACLNYFKLPPMQSVNIIGDISLMQSQGELEVSCKCHIIISTTFNHTI